MSRRFAISCRSILGLALLCAVLVTVDEAHSAGNLVIATTSSEAFSQGDELVMLTSSRANGGGDYPQAGFRTGSGTVSLRTFTQNIDLGAPIVGTAKENSSRNTGDVEYQGIGSTVIQITSLSCSGFACTATVASGPGIGPCSMAPPGYNCSIKHQRVSSGSACPDFEQTGFASTAANDGSNFVCSGIMSGEKCCAFVVDDVLGATNTEIKSATP